MDELPYIDDHTRVVDAPPEQVWQALNGVLGGAFRTVPGPLAAVWKLEQPSRVGTWTTPEVGDAIPGFAVAEVAPPGRLLLHGKHRFSRYQLEFTITADGDGRAALRARSSAEFPGIFGLTYRTLVITSRLHVIAVRRLLGRVARKVERGG